MRTIRLEPVRHETPRCGSFSDPRVVEAFERAMRVHRARVVLEAGFPADAVQAAYQALVAAIRALLEADPGPAHAALVAAVYRELLPKGRLAPAAPAALARLHDLTSLEEHGVEVDPGLAREAVTEAEGWVERLAG